MLDKLDPKKKENWKNTKLNWGVIVLILGVVGFVVVKFVLR